MHIVAESHDLRVSQRLARLLVEKFPALCDREHFARFPSSDVQK